MGCINSVLNHNKTVGKNKSSNGQNIDPDLELLTSYNEDKKNINLWKLYFEDSDDRASYVVDHRNDDNTTVSRQSDMNPLNMETIDEFRNASRRNTVALCNAESLVLIRSLQYFTNEYETRRLRTPTNMSLPPSRRNTNTGNTVIQPLSKLMPTASHRSLKLNKDVIMVEIIEPCNSPEIEVLESDDVINHKINNALGQIRALMSKVELSRKSNVGMKSSKSDDHT